MSSAEEIPELKGGHPPAVKAGGMRITQHKTQTNEKPTDAKKKEGQEVEEVDEEEEVVVEVPPKVSPLIISGAVARGNCDFPTDSVKAFHEKTPLPTNEFRSNAPKANVIHQPKK